MGAIQSLQGSGNNKKSCRYFNSLGENGGPTGVAAIVADEDGMVKFSSAGKTVSETNVRIVDNGVDTSKVDDILQKLSECYIFCNWFL